MRSARSRVARSESRCTTPTAASADLVVLGGGGAATLETRGCTVWPGLRNERAVEDLETELSELQSSPPSPQGALHAVEAGAFERLLAGEHVLRPHFGAIVLVSDLFAAAEMLQQVLDTLAGRTSRLHVVQLLGALDRKPLETARDVEWYDVETGQRFKVHYAPRTHREHVDQLVDSTRKTCEEVGANYVRLECPVRGKETDLVHALLDGEVLEEA